MSSTRHANSHRAGFCRGEGGASLLEALVAFAIVIAVMMGVAQLLAWSRQAAWSSAAKTMSVTLAAQKMERLQSLAWQVDSSGASVSDESADLSVEPAAAGGTGLQPSPPGTLSGNVPGFVDYLDATGQWRGTGARPPAGTAFVRRWAVEPLRSDASDSVVVTVIAFPLVDSGFSAGRPARGAVLKTIRTRTAQ